MLKEMQKKHRRRKGGKVKMCEVAENLKNEGIVEGKAEGQILILNKLVETDKINIEEAAEMLSITVEAFQEEVRRVMEKRLIV